MSPNRKSSNGSNLAIIILCSVILALIIGFGIYFIIKHNEQEKKHNHNNNHPHNHPNKYQVCRSRGLVWSERLKRCVRGYY